jgi:hypothetical protein
VNGEFAYVRPDEMWSLGATVSTTAGTTASDYLDDWLVDGRSGRPAKATSGTVTWSVAASAGEVGVVAICNHNVSVSVTIGGGISGSIAAPALPPDGIRRNPYLLPTPASITALTVAVASNPSAVIIGEVVAGKLRTCGALGRDTEFQEDDYGRPMQALSVQPFDQALASRRVSGVQIYTTAELAELIAWRQAERAASKPSLLIIDRSVQDAMLVRFESLSYRGFGEGWEVSMTFQEYPRVRW